MSAFDWMIAHGATLQECVAGVSDFAVGFDRLYIEGSLDYDGPLVAYIRCHGKHGSGPLSADEVRAILAGAEPVVEWESDPDPANDYVHWRVQEPAGHQDRRRVEQIASLLAAQLTLCLAGKWPRVQTPAN